MLIHRLTLTAVAVLFAGSCTGALLPNVSATPAAAAAYDTDHDGHVSPARAAEIRRQREAREALIAQQRQARAAQIARQRESREALIARQRESREAQIARQRAARDAQVDRYRKNHPHAHVDADDKHPHR